MREIPVEIDGVEVCIGCYEDNQFVDVKDKHGNHFMYEDHHDDNIYLSFKYDEHYAIPKTISDDTQKIIAEGGHCWI